MQLQGFGFVGMRVSLPAGAGQNDYFFVKIDYMADVKATVIR